MQEFGTTARDRLICNHTDAARRIALRMARRVPDWIQREDLISAGMIGLIEAADRYDESRQEPFIAFAEHRIRGAVLDELRRGDIMPRRVRQLARKVGEAIRVLEAADGEPPTEHRVASALGVSVEAYRAGIAQLVHVQISSLDGEEANLVSEHERAPDAEAEHRQTLDRVRVALDELAPRDVTILGLYFVEDLTYQEVADTLRVTPSRVCQLLWRAVERLREHLGEGSAAEDLV